MSLSNAQKAVLAAVGLLGALAALFIPDYDLSFTDAVVGLVGPVFAVIGVFAAKNHTPEDLQKALEAAKGAALAVVGYFTVVPAGTDMKVAVLIGAIATVFGVWWRPNTAYVYTLPSPEVTRARAASTGRVP